MICKILKRVFYDYYSYNAIKYEAAKEMINQVEEIDQEAAYQLDEISQVSPTVQSVSCQESGGPIGGRETAFSGRELIL